MELTKKSLANALGLATAIAWVVCSALVYFLPELSLRITQWWMHGLNIAPLGSWSLNLANFISGGITMTISAWSFGYVLGWSLKYFSKD